ncbi:paralemmin-1 isoform X2 [Microcebus murinus]|uniref:paralemmin-1 isoform X2 n=1 Tax=Microcebus murinus TaxID=30608 RepID=UPI003F6D1D3C
MEVLAAETTSQQERLQAIAEKRKRQAEIENKRRQLEDDRRQLQHLKSKALRERWLLEGTPSSASEGDEDLRRQMQEDQQKAQLLEGSISRLEKEIEVLESGDAAPAAAKENAAAPSPARAPAPSPAREEPKAEVVLNSQQTPVGTPKEKRVSNTPARTVEGSTMMKAAMYSVEITVEKDKVTGETRVLSSTTLLPREPLPQGIKVYEDETKGLLVVSKRGTGRGRWPQGSQEEQGASHESPKVSLSMPLTDPKLQPYKVRDPVDFGVFEIVQLAPLSSSKTSRHPRRKPIPSSNHSPPLPQPLATRIHVPSLWICLFWTFPINRVTHCMSFCVWRLSLSTMSSGSLHTVACVRAPRPFSQLSYAPHVYGPHWVCPLVQ